MKSRSQARIRIKIMLKNNLYLIKQEKLESRLFEKEDE
ncbi:unnamed protein product, partial [marine sediment metagenome]